MKGTRAFRQYLHLVSFLFLKLNYLCTLSNWRYINIQISERSSFALTQHLLNSLYWEKKKYCTSGEITLGSSNFQEKVPHTVHLIKAIRLPDISQLRSLFPPRIEQRVDGPTERSSYHVCPDAPGGDSFKRWGSNRSLFLFSLWNGRKDQRCPPCAAGTARDTRTTVGSEENIFEYFFIFQLVR